MTVFTHIAGVRVIGGFTRGDDSVVADNAGSENRIMIKIDVRPIRCAYMATLTDIEAQDMACRFTRCQIAVMTGYTG